MKKMITLLALALLGGQASGQIIERLPSGATLRVYAAAKSTAVGRAILIFPGGGYSYLASTTEGTDWVPWLKERGYTAAVLEYRMPKGNADWPLQDGIEALQRMRERSERFRITDGCVGVMGFSAGGHAASTVATHTPDSIRPKFQVLFYPVITMDPSYTHQGSHDNLLGADATPELEQLYSNELQVSAQTPPAFICYAQNDGTVPTANSENYYQALLDHNVPAYMKVYPTGGHGFGFKTTFAYHDDMLTELETWLGTLGQLLSSTVEALPADDARTGADDQATYTLDGRRVNPDLGSLPHGIYLRGGKKVRL